MGDWCSEELTLNKLNCGNGKDDDDEKTRRETFRFSPQDGFFLLTVPFKWVSLKVRKVPCAQEWKLICATHNLLKLRRSGKGIAAQITVYREIAAALPCHLLHQSVKINLRPSRMGDRELLSGHLYSRLFNTPFY